METPQADPFAEAAPDDAGADDPFAESAPDAAEEVATEPTAEEPPVVDKEGQPVEQPAEPAPAPDAPEAPQPPQEPAPAPAEEPPAPAPQEPAPAPEPAQEPEPQPEPQATAQEPGDGEPGPRGGKVQSRYYKLLYQTAERQWTEHDLPQGNENVVQRDGELWLKARNNEHALRLGYAFVGRPENGVTLFPVPQGAWKPKRVKPKARPQEPVREALEIS